MFLELEIDLAYYFQFLAERANHLADIMISKLVQQSYQFNRSICHQFDDIVSKITSHNKSTEELVTMENFIDNLRGGPLMSLQVH